MQDWRDEVDLYPEAMERIMEDLYKYPMSLDHCADIITLMGPLCMKWSPQGAIQKLRDFVEKEG